MIKPHPDIHLETTEIKGSKKGPPTTNGNRKAVYVTSATGTRCVYFIQRDWRGFKLPFSATHRDETVFEIDAVPFSGTGRKASGRKRIVWNMPPNLALAENRDAEIATNRQLLAIRTEFHPCAVDKAGAGIED
jgi:hypothetical protein